MGSSMQRDISFSHNGQTIHATLVDSPLAGGRTSEEICFICNHPLGDHPLYTIDTFEVYFHAHCFCTAATAAAAAASPPTDQSRSLSSNESRDIPYFPSAPPSNASHPSYSTSFPYQTYNYPSNYPTYQPPSNYYPHYFPYQASNHPIYQPPPNYYPHSSPYQAPNFPTYQPPPNYHPHSSSSSSSHSSLPVWTGIGIAASTVLESLMQAFFSSWFSN